MDDTDDGPSDHEELTKKFKDSFQSKLRKLSMHDDSKYKEQFKTLQKYVTDLSEQNEILVQTIEDLEQDSNEKIVTLENKLLNTEISSQEQVKRCDHLQSKIDNYEVQKKDMHEHMLVLEEEATNTGEENLQYQSQINNLEADVDELVELIKKARIDGIWELSKLSLKVVPIECLLHEKTIVEPLPRKKTEFATDDYVDELKTQLFARDRTISMLERELKQKTDQYHAVIDEVSHTGEVVDSVKSDMYQLERQQQNDSTLMSHKDFLIQRLKKQLKSFEESEEHLKQEAMEKDDVIASLQNDNDILQDSIDMRVIELKNKTQSIEILERHLKELKEKVLNDSLKDVSANSETHLQLQDANSKIGELHHYIDDLKLSKETNNFRNTELENEMSHLNAVNASLKSEINKLSQQCSKDSAMIKQLSDDLKSEKKKVSSLGLKIDSKMSNTETSLKKDIERKDREIKLLQGTVQRLENQRDDIDAKVALRDKAIERLQHQQKEYMDEVTRRDSALHSIELKLLQVEDEKRKAIDEVERVSKNYSIASKELKAVKEQHNHAVTEVGKLDAQIKAYQISNESESTVLTEEVAKREELIRNLKHENMQLEEEQKEANDKVESNMKLMEENEALHKELKEKLHNKGKMVIDLEAVIAALKTKDQHNKNKIEEYEDEAREIVLKLNSAERAQEQEAHKVLLTEEQLQELAVEMEHLHKDNQTLLKQTTPKNLMIEQLTSDVLHYKQSFQEKEKLNLEQQETLQKLEHDCNRLNKEFENLRRDNDNDLSTKDRKIAILEEKLEISHQRYEDVNEELTNVEFQCESMTKKYRELAETAERMQIQLQESKEDTQELEMNLAVTSEKHQTSVRENAMKDKTILNLQSELDATQQEFEHAVEELAQKAEEMENLHTSLIDLTGRCHSLECEREKSAKKIEENVDLINDLQMKNADLSKEICDCEENLEKLKHEIVTEQASYKNKWDEMQRKKGSLEANIVDLEEENGNLRHQVSSEAEKNAELLTSKNEEADGKQSAMFKYEDLRETFEDYKTESESEIRNLTDKVSMLESEMHSSTLKISQLDGSLKLTQEKLKNTETQLFEAERSSAMTELTVEGLELKVKEQDDLVAKNISTIDELEKSCSDYSMQMKAQTENMSKMQNELRSTKELLNNAKLRNTRCEEIIRELRDKLSSKFQDYDHQNEVLSRTETEYKTLQEIHTRVQNELTSMETLNADYTKEVCSLRDKLNDSQLEIEKLQEENQEHSRNLDVVIEEKTKANEKVVQLDEKFTGLKLSLERDNLSLIDENCTLKEAMKEKSELVSMLEQRTQVKSEENKLLEDKIIHVDEDLRNKSNELEEFKEELYNAEQTINELHAQLQKALEDKKKMFGESSQQINEINQLRSDLTETRHQYKDTAQQLAHYQERLSLTERNLSATQDQLSSRIAEIVKLEKALRKYQSDCKRLSEERKAKEIQIGQCNQLLDEARSDVEASKQKCHSLMEETKAQSATLATFESQLNDSHNQTEHLSMQLEKQQNSLKRVESSFYDLQQKYDDVQQQLLDKTDELENEKRKLSLLLEKEEELTLKQRDQESRNSQLRMELDNALQKNKSCLEQIASKDAELRVLKSDNHAQQKKCNHQERQIARSNDQIGRLQREIRELKESSSKAFETLSGHEYESEKLRNELLSAQSNQKEYFDQLAQKSKDLATVKSELQISKQSQLQVEQQYAIVDSKNKKLKSELKKSLERNKSSANELADLTKSVSEWKSHLQQSFDQQRQQNEELNKRDEKIVTLKVEVASMDERLKLKDEELDRLKNESLKLNQQHHKVLEQLHETKQELESVKMNGDRLTRESELVVENMNTWVKEQRYGNEKLASKMSNQTEKINQLEATNRKLKDETNHLREDLKKLELERLKKHQSHSAHNQASLQQLKSRVKELEDMVESEKREKEDSANELHNRLKTNVETIQQLHKQLSELNKENLRQRALLDRQSLSRKNLHAQLKSKENDIELLREDLNKSLHERDLVVDGSARRPPQMSKPDSISQLLNQELERAGVSSEEALDKSYWINRVSELSEQLQQSSDYWARKLTTMKYQNT